MIVGVTTIPIGNTLDGSQINPQAYSLKIVADIRLFIKLAFHMLKQAPPLLF